MSIFDDAVVDLVRVEKRPAAGMFGYAAGKSIIVDKIIPMLPPRKTFTEVFAGSAAVFFKSEKVATEVLNDIDPEVIATYRAIQGISDAEIVKLCEKDWTGSEALWRRLKENKGTGTVDLLHRFLYLQRFSYGKLRGKSYDHNSTGVVARGYEDRIKRGRERLKGTKLFSTGDYDKLVKQFDGKDAFHFMDPPYAGYNVGIGEKGFDEDRLRACMKSIRGRFLLTYGSKGKLDVSGFSVKKVRQVRSIRSMRGVSQSKFLIHLFVSNYDLAQKSLGDDLELAVVDGVLDLPPIAAQRLAKSQQLALAIEREVGPFLRRTKRWASGDAGGAIEGIAKGAVDLFESLDRFAYDAPDLGEAPDGELLYLAKRLRAELDGLSCETLPDAVHAAIAKAVPTLDALARLEGQLVGADVGSASVSLAKAEDALMRIPELPGPMPAVVQYHLVDGGMHADLRMAVDKSTLVGWSLDVAHPGALDRALDDGSAVSFTLQGDKITKGILFPSEVAATPKGEHPIAWLGADGAFPEGEVGGGNFGGGAIVKVDDAAVEFGLQTPSFHEYFFSKGDTLRGVLHVMRKGAGWSATVDTSPVPAVLRKDAVDAGAMPPEGRSGMPVALEAFVPHELRYWTLKGEDARTVRDALVERGVFTDDTVKLVDGGFTLVAYDMHIAPTPTQKRGSAGTIDVAKFSGAQVMFFGPSHVEKGEHAFDRCMSCKSAPAMEAIWADGRGRAWFCKAHWQAWAGPDKEIVRQREVVDGAVSPKFGGAAARATRKDDTAIEKKVHKTVAMHDIPIKIDRPKGFVQHGKDAAGAAWTRTYQNDYGYVPKTMGGDGDQLDVFVGPDPAATDTYWITQLRDDPKAEGGKAFDEFKVMMGFGCAKDAKAAYLAHVPAKHFGGMATMPVEQMKALLGKDPRVEKRAVRLLKADGAGGKDKQVVYGIVLEPETVDSQGDVYSADEVEEAAHRYLEDFRNAGLMHKVLVNQDAKVVESYIAPCDCTMGEQKIKKGTWMMAMHVLDPKLWGSIKSGELTGFSIGGSAQRSPEK